MWGIFLACCFVLQIERNLFSWNVFSSNSCEFFFSINAISEDVVISKWEVSSYLMAYLLMHFNKYECSARALELKMMIYCKPEDLCQNWPAVSSKIFAPNRFAKNSSTAKGQRERTSLKPGRRCNFILFWGLHSAN